MTEAWVTQRSVRLLLAVGTPIGGFALAVLLISQNDFAIATAAFSIALAALVGTGKLASP